MTPRVEAAEPPAAEPRRRGNLPGPARVLPSMRLLLLLLLAAPAQAGSYAFVGDAPTVPLSARFATPTGFDRVADPAPYAAWLRDLPLRTDRDHVLAFDGRALPRPAAAIAALDVGDGDLQQCADSAIRLHAEFLWASGQAERAAYHFTSGDRSAWADWRDGERFAIKGSRVERLQGEPRRDSWASYRSWLQYVFRYAGTRSLARDSAPVGADEPVRAGDVFVDPGSPGHAVVVLDLATDGRDHLALLGQGYMPAEDFHVLRSPDAVDGVWFRLPDDPDAPFDTPSWPGFTRGDLRRFR